MTTIRSVLLTSLALYALAACKHEERDRPQASGPALPALTAASPSAALPVNGFGASVVDVPAGATRPLPVVVAVLGIGDSPEEQCSTWRDIVGTRAFVLCPRGLPNIVQDDVEDGGGAEPADDAPEPVARSDSGRSHQVGFYPVDVASIDREISAGLVALKARYGAYVSDREVVYVGFSRGAFLGPAVATKHPERFRRLVLIEGGQSAWQPASVAAFAHGGASARVLFVCGQPKCVEESEPPAALLRGQKVDARVVHGVGEGHGYRKQVKEEVRRSFDWLTEGDALWRR